MKKLAGAAVFASLSSPAVALAATAPQNLQQLANQIASFFSSATIDLIVLALVVYFYGVTVSLFKGGEKDRETLKKQLLWGVAVIFFAVSIWGIVRLLQSTVFGQNSDPTNGGATSGQGTCTSLNCGQ